MNRPRPPRQTYKALLWDYDAILAASDQECSYCLTQREIDILLPVLDYIGWTTRYTSVIGTSPDQELLDTWQGELARKLMSGCCNDFTNTRYSATGIYEVSEDGGTTWTERRDLDPRFNAPLSPPLPTAPGNTLRCQSAGNVVGMLRTSADQLIADAGAWASVSGIISIVLVIFGLILTLGSAGILSPLLLGLCAALLQTGQTAFDAAMTEALYEQLLCIVYCHTPADGVYTEANWQEIKANILSDFDGIAEKWLHDNLNAMGLAGLNNAARSGIGQEGDCNLCACNECQFSISFDGLNWTEYTINWGSQSSERLNLVTHTYPLGEGTGTRILIDMVQDCAVNIVGFQFNFVNQRTIHDVGILVNLLDASLDLLDQLGGNNPEIANGVTAFAVFDFQGSVGRFIEIEVSWLNEAPPNTGWIDNITINF